MIRSSRLRSLLLTSQNRVHALSDHSCPSYPDTLVRKYVNVSMKWKKEHYLDSIDTIHKSLALKPIISVKNYFISSSSSPHDNYSIPISLISKKGKDFGINYKVARFLRSYPSFFEEFKGPRYDLPWFRLTDRAIELDKLERAVYSEFKDDIMERVKKLVLMSGRRKVLPLKIIYGLRWYLGLPNEFKMDPANYIEGYKCFRIVDIEDGLKGLAVVEDDSDEKETKILSVMQKNAIKKGVYSGGTDEVISFPLFASKGLRLKQKIKDWLIEFQRLPYISPYDDFLHLETDSDFSEKRVVGLLHELLCLFVEHAAERKSILILRKYLRLPQKVHKAFERHTGMFYLSLKNNTCTAILKEAYYDELAIEPHPLANVRKEYISLIKESVLIIRNRRSKGSRALDEENGSQDQEDCSCSEDERSLLAEDFVCTEDERDQPTS